MFGPNFASNTHRMAKKKPAPAPHTQDPKAPNHNWMPWLAAVLSLVLFSTGLHHPMVAMDDHTATINNPAVRDFTAVFRGNFNLGMFAPLTWWLYGIAYALGKENPLYYHLFSAMLHAANVWLVWHIARQLQAAPWPALFIALAFAVHPLQVEPIVWIAGMSTPLFSFFLLLATQSWLRYTGGSASGRPYGLALLFFGLACLAKSAAVVFPLSLLALDFWQKRPLSRRTMLEKVPYLGIALVFGLLTLYSRGASGHQIEASGSGFTLTDRFFMAAHTILFYWSKLLWPTGLSIWYPFERNESGAFPWPYYAAPVALAAILYLAWRYRAVAPLVFAGLMFYLSNIVLALPFYTIGEFELRSDRYNYLAAIGLFAIISALPLVVKNTWRLPVNILTYLVLVAWFVLSLNRISDWKDTIKLIDKAISAQGDNFGKAYLWRGMSYGDRGKGRQALQDFTQAIERNPDLALAYKYRGTLYGLAKQYEQSVADLDRYLQRFPNDGEYIFNRGLSLMNLGRTEEALADFNKAIALRPNFAPPYRSRGQLLLDMGEQEKGQADLDRWEKIRSTGR